jgi:hypothetical protein
MERKEIHADVISCHVVIKGGFPGCLCGEIIYISVSLKGLQYFEIAERLSALFPLILLPV